MRTHQIQNPPLSLPNTHRLRNTLVTLTTPSLVFRHTRRRS